jgi:hypothetical protein
MSVPVHPPKETTSGHSHRFDSVPPNIANVASAVSSDGVGVSQPETHATENTHNKTAIAFRVGKVR